MDKEEIDILKKAIEKAENNGFNFGKRPKEKSIEEWYRSLIKEPYTFIFSHFFAKAFWGETILYVCVDCNKFCGKRPSGTSDCCHYRVEEMKSWQIQLQNMVLEENPILYLSKFL